MLDNEKMFKLLSTQILMSIAEPSVALKEEKTHPFSPTPLFISTGYYEHCEIYREPYSEHQYTHHLDSTIANTLLYILDHRFIHLSIYRSTSFLMHFRISCKCHVTTFKLWVTFISTVDQA